MRFCVPLFAILLAACEPPDPFPLPTGGPGVQAVSLLGDSLVPGPAPDSVRAAQWIQLDSAHAALVARPDDPDAWIWLGRRLAYLGHYRPALTAYTEALAKHPGDARLLRHRGHRYLTIRELGAAVEDFTRAATLVRGMPDEVEPDGQPNALGIPTSTLQFNIWYHLGLARYLQGDFERALPAYRECLAVSTNPDALVATSYWLYLTQRRLGRDSAAAAALEPITADLTVIENDAYHRLLLLFRGDASGDDLLASARSGDAIQNATVAYGVGAWALVNGDTARAGEIFRGILDGPQWAGFGYLAAEAELARAREVSN
jgi:tetratricopeptide (TPR) repeat protein